MIAKSRNIIVEAEEMFKEDLLSSEYTQKYELSSYLYFSSEPTDPSNFLCSEHLINPSKCMEGFRIH